MARLAGGKTLATEMVYGFEREVQKEKIRMRYKVFGWTGVKVSESCLRAMYFVGTSGMRKAIGALDGKDSIEMVVRVLDAQAGAR